MNDYDPMERMREIEIFGVPALFTDKAIPPEAVHPGMSRYELLAGDGEVAGDLELDEATLQRIDQIAREYEAAGADAVSCLTEPKWFLGSDGIFQAVRREISLPMLRKDFTVDEYQIYQARYLGAEAVLLICSLLETETLARFLDLAHRLGLAALVEAHDEKEIRSAVEAGAEIIGVNNRNLKDFSVDFSNAARLRDLIPPGCVYVAESGVTGPEDAAALRKTGADAALIGEALMRAEDKRKKLAELRGLADAGKQAVRKGNI